MIVLDTNVVSELMRPRPDERVVRWVAACRSTDLYTTSVTQAEILLGVALLPDGRRKSALKARADEMFAIDLADRILAFDSAAATNFASIVATRQRAGRTIAPMDAEIAAIAIAANATVATRNVWDFEGCGVVIVDPWAA